MKKLARLAILVMIICSGCSVMYTSKNQKKVTITVPSDRTKIFVDGALEGIGTTTFKTRKDGIKQIVLRTPGYKDNYYVMIPTRRPPAFWVGIANDILFFPIIPTFIYDMIMDHKHIKTHGYELNNDYDLTGKIMRKKPGDKFIRLSRIKIDLKGDQKLVRYHFRINRKTMKKIDEKMTQLEDKRAKKEYKDNEKLSKKEQEWLKGSDAQLRYDQIAFSHSISQTLRSSGYVDTVNKVFRDENNTIVLEGKITKISVFEIQYRGLNFVHRYLRDNSIETSQAILLNNNWHNLLYRQVWNIYYKVKIEMTWYIKNRYGEKLDSIKAKEVSGDFLLDNYMKARTRAEEEEINTVDQMIGDAVENSYLNLFNNKSFKKYMPSSPDAPKSSDPPLRMQKPAEIVKNNTDAALASVIIKREDGVHGSGFAVSQDGYIITVYHLIASTNPGKPEDVEIVTSDGEEQYAKVVRVNKEKDIALLKINYDFKKAFLLSNEKTFKLMENVFTVGAPKSLELGQTVTSGVLSNERNANNCHLLQLNMALNSGSSGGPLFNAQGVLSGVVVSKLTGTNTEGIGFAIPSYLIGDYINVFY